MSRPCPRCQTLKKGAFYRDKGEFICEDCEEAVIMAESRSQNGTKRAKIVFKRGKNDK